MRILIAFSCFVLTVGEGNIEKENNNIENARSQHFVNGHINTSAVQTFESRKGETLLEKIEKVNTGLQSVAISKSIALTVINKSDLMPPVRIISTGRRKHAWHSGRRNSGPTGVPLKKGIPIPSLLAQLRTKRLNSESVEYQNGVQVVLRLDKIYSPSQIADYVHQTGDERRISQFFSDMIQEGEFMASRDDVIQFLEEVQMELDELRRSGAPS